MRKFVALYLFLLAVALSPASAFIRGGNTSPPVCAAGVLDTFVASPGSWTEAASMRKVRAAYAGSAIQVQRSSDSATLDVGFAGCDPNTSATSGFCSTQTLVVGTTSSTRVAYPTGSVIHVFNQGPNLAFWASGNSSITVANPTNPLAGGVSALPFREGVNITVGADTNLAAIIGTGFGPDGGTGAATLFLTNCGISKAYNQSNSGAPDFAQTTLANQGGYGPNIGKDGGPRGFGCLAGCNLHAPDSAIYKTATIETFSLMTFGEDISTTAPGYVGVGYPSTTSSSGFDLRWGLTNGASPDVLINNLNGVTNANAEGFGGIWRGQNLTQFDYSTGGILRWNGGTQFLNSGGGTPTYPNAVGMYIMGDANGGGTPGEWFEFLVASGTQTVRDSISANQVSYASITTGTAVSIPLTNPLGDGFNFNQIQLGGFAPNPPGSGAYAINGNGYSSEAAWNTWSQWQCSNCISTGGRLGDMFRFQATYNDEWSAGTTRSELDGANVGQTSPAQFGQGINIWISDARWVEPGTAYTSSWNITGQFHTIAGNVCCVFNTQWQNEKWLIGTFNANTGAQNAISYTSPTATRAAWYHFVYKVFMSVSGTTDTFQAWCDCVTPGTMASVMTDSGSLYGGSANTAGYWKIGIYRETGGVWPAFAIRYGNVQACTQGTDCTTKYGVSDLSALTTTPLANPSH